MLGVLLSLEGALGLAAAESLPEVLSLFAGAAAASFMHFSFSAPVMDSQLALLLCPEAVLLSPVALCVELCANETGENASKVDARLAASNLTFMCGSLSRYCGAKASKPYALHATKVGYFAEAFVSLTRTNAREPGPPL